MALTRKMLEEWGIDSETAEKVIKGHMATTNGVKDDLDALQRESEGLKKQLEEANSQLEEAKKAAADDDTGAKLKAVQDEFAAYKANIEAKEVKEAAERLFKEQLRAAKVDDRYDDLAMKDVDLSKFSVKDGAFEDAAAVEKAVAGFAEKYPQFITSTSTQGASTGNPPAKSGGQAEPSSLADALRQRYSEKG